MFWTLSSILKILECMRWTKTRRKMQWPQSAKGMAVLAMGVTRWQAADETSFPEVPNPPVNCPFHCPLLIPESWTSHPRGASSCVVIPLKVNYSQLLSRVGSSTERTGTEQTLRGWIECVRVYLGGGEPGENGVLTGLSRRRAKHPQPNLKDAQNKLPWFPNLARAGPGTFPSFRINYSWVNISHVFKSQWAA